MGDDWPEPDSFPAQWLVPGCGVTVLWGARNELHQFWATHTSDLDGHTDYYWADEITECRKYTSSGELFVAMTELGYSGPCTILQWDLSLVKESEVIV